MAVQAQYPSNAHLFITTNNNNRSEQERKEMDYSSQNPSAFFSSNGTVIINGNQARKRTREFQMVPYTPQMNLAQLQHHQHQIHPPTISPNLVSTGLRLSFPDVASQSQFAEESIASIVNQHKDEIEQYLDAQGEHLRRALEEKRQQHYRALLGAAEESAARRLREKEAELSRAVRRTAELEECIDRLRAETMTWQAKAMTEQATAASLHAEIQLVPAATRPDGCGAGGGDMLDAVSATHVEPDRDRAGVSAGRACRVCGVSAVSVVLLPCRHLCMCAACEEGVGVGEGADAVCCPVCHAVRTGSVQVIFSS